MSATEAHEHPTLTVTDRARLGRRAQLLAGASVTYNVVEAVIAVTAGIAAGSVALVGFGLDSVVEVSSGLIILWQFRHRLPESRERQALRLMAFSFFGLAAYVTFESVRALFFGGEPEPSPVGIGLAIASLVIMPFLSWAQRRTGRALGSHAVVADSTQTLLCTYLSAVLLVGTGPERDRGVGMGGPAGRARHRGGRGQGRRRRLARRRVLVPGRTDGEGEGPGDEGDVAAGCRDDGCTSEATAPQLIHITSSDQTR